MSVKLEDLKFTETELHENSISSLPDRIVGQAGMLKSRFDKIGKDMIGLGRFNSLIDALKEQMHPVGSIYFTVDSQNPSALLGGEWAEWGRGRVPVGADADQQEFAGAEHTGGSKWLQEHTHTTSATSVTSGSNSNAISINARPQKSGGSVAGGYIEWAYTTGGNKYTSDNNHQHSVALPALATGAPQSRTNEWGTGAANGRGENLQPYITCYMWKRVA